MSEVCTMKIVLASKNAHKIAELQALLSEHIENIEILSLADAGIEGEIVEDGKSFAENALIKARAAASSGYIGVGDDSGLCVRALGGAPGIYSARYSGEHGNDKSNNELLLKNLEGETDRYAEFVCDIACVFPDGRELVARGECPGTMLFDYRGNGGFGYDPLFLYEPMDKTFAQMNAEEKNSISHRARAMAKFAKLFAAENK